MDFSDGQNYLKSKIKIEICKNPYFCIYGGFFKNANVFFILKTYFSIG